MVVVLKRFGMDDVPCALLDCDMDFAVSFVKGMSSAIPSHATERDQRIAHTGIGTELSSLLLVEFDKHGLPKANSKIVNIGE